MDARVKSDFALWMEKMGCHGKQVTEAGNLISIGNERTAGATYRGERELSETERLAMAAVRAGLPPWTPETDQQIADMGQLTAIFTRMYAAMKGRG